MTSAANFGGAVGASEHLRPAGAAATAFGKLCTRVERRFTIQSSRSFLKEADGVARVLAVQSPSAADTAYRRDARPPIRDIRGNSAPWTDTVVADEKHRRVRRTGHPPRHPHTDLRPLS
jgi:hypothetical protein